MPGLGVRGQELEKTFVCLIFELNYSVSIVYSFLEISLTWH